MFAHLAQSYLLFAAMTGIQVLWLLYNTAKELLMFVNMLWHFQACVWWKHRQGECDGVSSQKVFRQKGKDSAESLN